MHCSFKECTFSGTATATATGLSAMLGLSLAIKEKELGTPGAKLDRVTVDPAAQRQVGEWGHGSPCTVEIMRQPLNTLLCSSTDDLGKCRHSCQGNGAAAYSCTAAAGAIAFGFVSNMSCVV